MDVRITPSVISGGVSAIGSKSDIHRLLILSAMCCEPTVIEGFSRCEDTLATVDCIRALGAECEISGKTARVTPPLSFCEKASFNCRESGSTLRFLLPVAAAVCKSAEFFGAGRLPERPIGELMRAMQEGGAEFSNEKIPFKVSGGLKAGRYRITGSVSSQYISGLLMALAVTPGESEIILTSPLESASYVKMTLASLALFGASVIETERGYKIYGSGRLTSPKRVVADGDWSNGAFFIVNGVINGKTEVSGLCKTSVQGDKKVTETLKAMGALVEAGSDGTVTSAKSELLGTRIDLTDTPDLLPILAVAATQCKSETEFCGAARLRLKESDRLKTVADMINALGGRAEILPDGLRVYPSELLGGRVDGCNDHRIVMAAAIAAGICKNETVILGAEAVNKSYPEFFEDYIKLGGKVSFSEA